MLHLTTILVVLIYQKLQNLLFVTNDNPYINYLKEKTNIKLTNCLKKSKFNYLLKLIPKFDVSFAF